MQRCTIITLALTSSVILITIFSLIFVKNSKRDSEQKFSSVNISPVDQINNERLHRISQHGAIVKLPKYGSLEGSIDFTTWTNRTIYQFLNVPYAESPSGPKRFKAPVSVKPWDGIRNATKYGTKCPVLTDIVKMKESDLVGKDIEDCLIMAIFSSNLNESLPVMVYIHGGAFYENNAHQYPPNYI